MTYDVIGILKMVLQSAIVMVPFVLVMMTAFWFFMPILLWWTSGRRQDRHVCPVCNNTKSTKIESARRVTNYEGTLRHFRKTVWNHEYPNFIVESWRCDVCGHDMTQSRATVTNVAAA